MSDEYEGGPAFPFNALDFQPSTGIQVVRDQFSGMSLRDWFAGKVLSSFESTDWIHPIAAAIKCYEIADAMLEARKK